MQFNCRLPSANKTTNERLAFVLNFDCFTFIQWFRVARHEHVSLFALGSKQFYTRHVIRSLPIENFILVGGITKRVIPLGLRGLSHRCIRIVRNNRPLYQYQTKREISYHWIIATIRKYVISYDSDQLHNEGPHIKTWLQPSYDDRSISKLIDHIVWCQSVSRSALISCPGFSVKRQHKSSVMYLWIPLNTYK